MAIVKMLLKFDTKENNNKFYKMTLQDSGEIECDFGRVGYAAQTKHYSGGQREFDKILKSKNKKGYREVEIEDSVEAIGSGIKVKAKTNVIDVALKQIKYLDDTAKRLVQTIAENNIHQITSNSSVKFDSETGMFTTALGIIKRDAVERALLLLVKAESLLVDEVKNEDDLFDTSSDYFMIIPNIVSNAREKRNLLFSQTNIDKQRDVCSSLLETLDLISDLKDKAATADEPKEVEEEKVFDVTIGSLPHGVEYDRLVSYYENSKKSMHSSRVISSKIKNIYTIEMGTQLKPFEKSKESLGNVVEVFHGTRLANLLSILARGLLLPKNSPGQQAGAAFGLGVYGAINSSKSAGYCDSGMYSGGSSNSMYMFIADFVMGNVDIPVRSGGSSQKPKAGCHSLWAKAGHSGVINDELIVYSLDQIKLKYLLEIKI